MNDGTTHAVRVEIRPLRGDPRHEIVQTPMAVMLNCPKCQGETELRGTMDAYYLTWCPQCERLWRLELWTLLNAADLLRKHPWLTSR
jgi:hypothetical protein